jgi:hypothetical protein
MRRLALLIAAIGLFAALPGSAAAKTVFASNGCGKSEYKPTVIAFACADGKLLLADTAWQRWDSEMAVAVGSLNHPELDHPSCAHKPVFACPWSETEATATLWRPLFCPSNSRWQFTRLRIEAPDDPDPEVRDYRRDYRCSEYRVRQPPARWKKCGGQNKLGAGWGDVRSLRIGCTKARAVAHRYTWSKFSGNPSPSPYGFVCQDFPVASELSSVACRRTQGHRVQKVKFEYGA